MAANWDDSADPLIPDVRTHPIACRYVDAWGRPGDAGLLAETDNGDFVGACWYRRFAVGEVWGTFDANAPTLTIGVLPRHRRQGIGKRLLGGTIALARESRVDRLGLSVARENTFAIALYESFGFERVGHEDGSFNMSLDLREAI